MAKAPRKISAKEVLADIRASASDEDLMIKYHLTESQLQALFAKLVTSGLIDESELEERKASGEASMAVSPPLSVPSRDLAVTRLNEANALVEKASSKSELELALTKYEQASQIFLRLNEHEDACKALNQMGGIYERLEQYDKQLQCYERSLAIFRKVGHLAGESAVLFGIAGVYESLGQHEKAEQFAKRSVDLFSQRCLRPATKQEGETFLVLMYAESLQEPASSGEERHGYILTQACSECHRSSQRFRPIGFPRRSTSVGVC